MVSFVNNTECQILLALREDRGLQVGLTHSFTRNCSGLLHECNFVLNLVAEAQSLGHLRRTLLWLKKQSGLSIKCSLIPFLEQARASEPLWLEVSALQRLRDLKKVLGILHLSV